MEQKTEMLIDMTDDHKDCMLALLHKGEHPSIDIFGVNCPATISLTPDQAFHLFVELKSALKKVQLSLKERG